MEDQFQIFKMLGAMFAKMNAKELLKIVLDNTNKEFKNLLKLQKKNLTLIY